MKSSAVSCRFFTMLIYKKQLTYVPFYFSYQVVHFVSRSCEVRFIVFRAAKFKGIKKGGQLFVYFRPCG